ncbi:MAG TPA: non-ribosomal peptide synthetase [Steroidobacteraceae bacterium]|nr:non-ribosomal peptide synthetase [Steroidobacteraceae bacterium]
MNDHSPARHATLIDVLEANRGVDRVISYIDGESSERQVPYRDLHARSLGILYHLQALGAQRGDKMIMFLSNNEQFIDGFWAALCGGIVPVPLAVGISDEHRHKLLRVARKLGKALLYTDSKNLERLRALAEQVGESALFQELKSRAFLVESITDISRPGKLVRPAPDDLAFIQFSSGSTSEPKGVTLTHGNLLANTYGATTVGKFTDRDISLSWMPLTHDMGLIGFFIMQFVSRAQINLMPTDLFVRRPLLWLQMAAKKRITITCSPNFGYRHFLKVLGDRRLDGIDLSSIRLIYNGAEPISVELCNEFMGAMAYTGLKRSAMYPVYGLAEASLAVTLPEVGRDYRWVRVNRHNLGIGAAVQLNPPGTHDVLEIMCVGPPVPPTEVRVADDSRQPFGERQVGHILIRGANVTRGYFNDPAATSAAISPDGWLDTGDLGFAHEGSLYITGRSKEIIFVNGQNYYPYDLENIAQRAPGLELNKVVAAGIATPASRGEDLVVFVLHRGSMGDFLPTAAAVSRLINEHTGLEVAEVIPTKRIPKTTSGKVQRHLLEKAYLEGEFAAELAELGALREAQGGLAGQVSGSEIENRLQSICETALAGKRVGSNDNLFEIGASSLKLIEIHENIDREYPGLIDLTELFDHPTIADLAKHLEAKLAAKQG